MKKILLFLIGLTGLFFGSAVSADERLNLAVGDSTDITLPFSVENYKATPPNKVKIDSVSDTKIRITGLAQGECQVSVSGGTVSRDYHISVVSNLKHIIRKLRTELQELSELDIAINQDAIIIRGTISDPEKWNHLQRVLGYYSQKDIKNFTKFVPSAETFLNLKKMLQDAGYTFAKDGEKPQEGMLAMHISRHAVVISGKVYSQTEIEEIKNIVLASRFCVLASNQSELKDLDGKIQAILNLEVVQTQIAVDVAFLAIGNNDTLNAGSGSDPITGTVSFKAIYDILAGAVKNSGSSPAAEFGGDLTRTISFLKKNNISRIEKAGSVTFTNSSATGGYLKVGGTNYLPVSGVGGGSFQEVNYGFIVTIKGSLLSRSKMTLSFDLEYSYMTGAKEKAQSNVRTERIINLGKTTVLGGFKEITKEISNAGMPSLRNTPIIQWFVGQQDDTNNQSDMLVLVCPRICSDPKTIDMTIPLTDQIEPVVKDTKLSNGEYREKQKKYSGWLYWLNWFSL